MKHYSVEKLRIIAIELSVVTGVVDSFFVKSLLVALVGLVVFVVSAVEWLVVIILLVTPLLLLIVVPLAIAVVVLLEV